MRMIQNFHYIENNVRKCYNVLVGLAGGCSDLYSSDSTVDKHQKIPVAFYGDRK